MTAFLPSDIPAEINTVEKLAVWAATLLTYLNTDLTSVEATGSQTKTCSAGPFHVSASDPAVWRHISRISVVVEKEWQGSPNQIWNYVREFNTAPIPAIFKS
jgi:hypothetical protein